MEHDLNTAKAGKSQRDYLHFENRLPWTLLENLVSTAPPWKRNDVPPPDKKPRTFSTGEGVAFIVALAVGIAFIVLVSVFVIFRRRYGPGYTVWSFVTGKRHKKEVARSSTVPVSIESGIPCKEMPSNPSRGSMASKPRDSKCVTGTNNHRGSKELCQTQTGLHGRQSAIIDPHRLSAPLRDLHPGRAQMEDKETGNTGCRQPPPATLQSLQKSDTRAATEQLRALAPTSPCSSRFTTSTQSSGVLPSIYRMTLESRSHKRNSSNNTNCWSYNHDARSAVDSEDRVLSLPSPSPMLRNMLRPSPKSEPVHVYRQIQRPPSAHCDTKECDNDAVLPMLPRSVFAVNDLVVSN